MRICLFGAASDRIDKSYIEEWLLKEDANENKIVLTFLNTFGKYYESYSSWIVLTKDVAIFIQWNLESP